MADADEALRVAGLNLRSLFDRFPFAVQVFSDDGRLHYVNPAFRTLWGLDETWAPPPDYNAFENPHLEPLGFLSSVRRGFAGETVTLPRTRYTIREMPTLPEGRPRWVRSFIYPVKDDADETRAVVVMHADITEREEAQQLLEERVAERTSEIATLLKVSQSAASTLDLGALLSMILEQLKLVADYSGSTVIVLEGDHFRVLDDRGGATPDQSNTELIGTTWPATRRSAIWETVSRQEPVIIDDVRDDSELAHAFRQVTQRFEETPAIGHVRSWLGVPLAIKDRVIGFIGISKDEVGYYTPHHARLAMAIATHAAAAIENARLYEEQRRAAEELSTLLAISRNVSSTLELEPLFGLILDQLQPVVAYTSATVATGDGERYVIREYRGPLPREVVLSRPLLVVSGPLTSIPENEPFIIPDLWEDTPMARAFRAARGEEYLRTTASYLRCMLIAPLMHKGQTVGALTLTHQTPGFFTDHHAALAQAVAD
ncbi:MAG: GAF domain-containing protein, partial [Dehalococcoidia bacterium]